MRSHVTIHRIIWKINPVSIPGGDDVELLIIDDGSKDSTGDIADAYEKKYPGIIRAIHQENGGHGEAVNAGIRNATGLYFKVVDSDDWVDYEAYKKILDKLRELAGNHTVLDMFIANYVYEKEGVRHQNDALFFPLKIRFLPGMMCHVSERTVHSDAFCHLSYKTTA